jgi:hypothetical protein
MEPKNKNKNKKNKNSCCKPGISDSVTKLVPVPVKALPGKLLRGSDLGVQAGKVKGLSA